MFSQVDLIRELGRGAFGKVWEGVLTTRESVTIPDDKKTTTEKRQPQMIEKKTTVAVKMLRG